MPHVIWLECYLLQNTPFSAVAVCKLTNVAYYVPPCSNYWWWWCVIKKCTKSLTHTLRKWPCVSKDLSTLHDRCNLETNNAFLYLLCGGKGFFNFPNGIPVSTTPLVAACTVNSVIRPDTHKALPQKCVKITMITHVDIRYGWRRHSGCQSIYCYT